MLNDFITKLTTKHTRGQWAWIGGYRTGLGQSDFAWEDGSDWNYTNWKSEQPDNLGGNGEWMREDCVHTNFNVTQTREGNGYWNDIPCDFDIVYMGYVCQKNCTNVRMNELSYIY